MSSGTRIDVWLWAVRVYKTRSAANTACANGAVRIDGAVVKPSRTVQPGDRVTARLRGFSRDLEVVTTPTKRVGAALAAEAYVDHTPPREPRPERPAPVASREPGAGRPTKRERRQMDRFRSGDSDG